MTPIKVAAENRAAIEAELKAVNGRATKHAYTRYTEIANLAVKAEKELEQFGLPKALRKGARYWESSGEYLPNAYNNTAAQTRVTLERRSTAWYLVDVEPAKLYPKQNNVGHLQVTQHQADEATKRFLSTVTILTPEAELQAA